LQIKTRGKDILNKFHVTDDSAGYTDSADRVAYSNDQSVSYMHGPQKQTNVNFNSDFIGAEKPAYIEPL